MTKEEELKEQFRSIDFALRNVSSEALNSAFQVGAEIVRNKAIAYIKENVFKYMPFVEESVKEKIINEFKEAMSK